MSDASEKTSADIVPFEEGESLTMERVHEALEIMCGNLAGTARALGKRRNQLADFINTKPELKALLQDLREEIVDAAESNIFAAVKKGDDFSSRFVVERLGKDRGWVPRAEATGKDGAPLPAPTIIFERYADEEEDSPPAEPSANDRD